MNDYKILELEEKSVAVYKDCFDKNGSPKKETIIRWQFLENPVAKTYVDIAVDKLTEEVAAIYAIFPVRFKLEDKVVIGSQSLDTITDVNHRGKGLFINLAKSVFQKAKNDDVKFVYGFPNGNSIYGFEKKLEWSVLDPVPFLIKPLRTSYFTKKVPFFGWLPNINLVRKKNARNPQFIIKKIRSFPQEVDKIWESFSNVIAVGIQRDKAYLTWRYVNKPEENYQILHAYSKEGIYLGFVVYTVKEKHNGKIGYIMELIYDPITPKIGKLLLEYAVNEINLSKADCVLSWCLSHSPNYHSYKSIKFFNMPEKLRPIELHFGARSFDKDYEAIILNRKNWYLSYSDSDTV